MSLTKRALPEDIDITSPLEQANPAEEAELAKKQEEIEIGLGWSIHDLNRSARILHDNAVFLTVGDLQDISEAVQKLQDIPKKVNKPF